MIKQVASEYTSFEGARRIASGDLAHVVARTKEVLDRGERGPVILFDDATSRPVEIDFRGDPAEVQARLASYAADAQPKAETSEEPRRPGRPKLGVIGREVTLLPRHWDWLNAQPGGASVALRKLVEQARRDNEGRDRRRAAQESAYRFISTMAGNQPNFEDALRALFAGDAAKFRASIVFWPIDVRDHAEKLAAPSFETPAA